MGWPRHQLAPTPTRDQRGGVHRGHNRVPQPSPGDGRFQLPSLLSTLALGLGPGTPHPEAPGQWLGSGFVDQPPCRLGRLCQNIFSICSV